MRGEGDSDDVGVTVHPELREPVWMEQDARGEEGLSTNPALWLQATGAEIVPPVKRALAKPGGRP